MASLSESLFYVLSNEGKIFTNDPQDNGGATKFGITQNLYSEFLERSASIEDIKAINTDIASRVYYKMFWKPLGLDSVTDQSKATAIFDLSINMGKVRVVKGVQRIVGATVDGHIGPLTISAINNFNKNILLEELSIFALGIYEGIVIKYPDQIKFINGWRNRAERIRSLKE